MQTTVKDVDGAKVVVVVFDKGDEVIAGLTAVARDFDLPGASFTAVGGFERVVLGYFDRHRRDYDRILMYDQVEVLSLVGDMAMQGDEHKVHAHVVVGRRDGMAMGGHVLEGVVWPTLEVVVRDTPVELRRRHDDETGLALIDLGET